MGCTTVVQADRLQEFCSTLYQKAGVPAVHLEVHLRTA